MAWGRRSGAVSNESSEDENIRKMKMRCMRSHVHPESHSGGSCWSLCGCLLIWLIN